MISSNSLARRMISAFGYVLLGALALGASFASVGQTDSYLSLKAEVEKAQYDYDHAIFSPTIERLRKILPRIEGLPPAQRKELETGVYFYWGASLVALNKTVEAENYFRKMFTADETFRPEDPGAKILTILEKVRRDMGLGPMGSVAGLPQEDVESTAGDYSTAEGIERRIEALRVQIIQGKDLDVAINELSSLLPRAARLGDYQRLPLTAKLYFWIGRCHVLTKNFSDAANAYRDMYITDHEFVGRSVGTIENPETAVLFEYAEKLASGVTPSYRVKISSTPEGADIKIDGKPEGKTPKEIVLQRPWFELMLSAKAYKTLTETKLATSDGMEFGSVLVLDGLPVTFTSIPAGAKVTINDKTLEKPTPCSEVLQFGPHKVKFAKDGYSVWEETVNLNLDKPLESVEAILYPATYRFFAELGGKTVKDLSEIEALAINRSGDLFVLDRGKKRIWRFTKDLTLQKAWGGDGQPFIDLGEPKNIALDRKGYIYVCDTRKHRIFIYRNSGTGLDWEFGKLGPKPGQFNTPVGMAFDSQNNCYIADQLNNRIQVLSPADRERTQPKVWGKFGTGPGDFRQLRDIAVGPKDEVLVLDADGIKVFTPDGTFTGKSWGKSPNGVSDFVDARGLCVDRQGCVFVADRGNNRVIKFDPEGRFIGVVGMPAEADKLIKAPIDVAVDELGRIYVVNGNEKRVLIFAGITGGD